MQHPRQNHQPHWLSFFLFVLLCTILVQSLDATAGFLLDPRKHEGLDVLISKELTNVVETVNGLRVPAKEGITLDRQSESVLDPASDHRDQRNSLPSSGEDLTEDRDVVILDGSTSTLDSLRSLLSSVTPSSSSSPSLQRRDSDEAWDNNSDDGAPGRRAQGYAYRPDVKVATTLCNSETPQVQGPGWNGSFFTNSEGVYPSQTRSCTWTMLAYTNKTFVETTTPFIIQMTFWSPIQLVCG